MVNIERKFIFTHPKKCAGTSIEKAFRDELNLSKEMWDQYLNRHAPLKCELDIVKKHGYDEKDFFKFSIIRNPWDRVVSMYYYLIHREVPKAHICKNPKMAKYLLKIKEMTFNEFCVFEFESSDFKQFETPTRIYLFDDDEYKIDYVIKYENITEGYNFCMKKLNLLNLNYDKLQRIHGDTPRPKKIHYRRYYDKRTKEMVAKHFEFDIDFFKYTF